VSSHSLSLRQNTTCHHMCEPMYSTFLHSEPLAVTIHELLYSDVLGRLCSTGVHGSMYTGADFRNVVEFLLKIVSQFCLFSV
jgi:hypothetical protein